MKDTKSNEIKVGAISIAGILLLVLGITFGKSLSFSNPENVLKFRFPESNGLQSGEPVVVNGVDRGRVIKVFNSENAVTVEAELNDISDIYDDASAKITILEITGGKKIEIHPGNSGNPIQKDQFIKGTTPPDIAGLVAVVGELSTEGANIIKRIDTLTLYVNSFLSDGEFLEDIKQTMANARYVSDDIRYFTDNNLDKLSASVDNLYSLSGELQEALDNDSVNIRTIMKDIDVVLDNTRQLTSDAKNTLKNADELILNINDISRSVKDGNGAVSKLIYDEKFAAELDSVMVNLERFISVIKEHGINVNVRLGTRP